MRTSKMKEEENQVHTKEFHMLNEIKNNVLLFTVVDETKNNALLVHLSIVVTVTVSISNSHVS